MEEGRQSQRDVTTYRHTEAEVGVTPFEGGEGATS